MASQSNDALVTHTTICDVTQPTSGTPPFSVWPAPTIYIEMWGAVDSEAPRLFPHSVAANVECAEMRDMGHLRVMKQQRRKESTQAKSTHGTARYGDQERDSSVPRIRSREPPTVAQEQQPPAALTPTESMPRLRMNGKPCDRPIAS
ncbi:unnamed protein product [Cercospora beticola]|nr:unnamed protein product [Cercospora beticola]